MKESGINHFFAKLGLDTGSFKVFYSFEEGTAAQINSISGGQSYYTGTLSAINDFWIKPGSGFFSGNNISIANASGLYSNNFTHLFVFEKRKEDRGYLLNSLTSNTGYNIGLTDSNKIFFETYNNEPVVSCTYNNISSKNLISVSYLTNFVEVGYYNFNAKTFEFESFDYQFGDFRSDIWKLGQDFTGYIDYYLYFSEYLGQNVLNSLASGLYNIPTGKSYETETVCTNTITGYQSVFVAQTGITGYTIIPSGGDGINEFTGLFPATNITVSLTGILSSGLFQSGVTGLSCVTYTGEQTDLYDILTGYVSSFGMEKILVRHFVESGDILKYSKSTVVFDDNYNKIPQRIFSGYNLVEIYTTGGINIFTNGLAESNSGIALTGFYLVVSGASNEDILVFDVKSGDKNLYTGYSTYVINSYSGQEIFFNGLNLVSGYDFSIVGTNLTLTGNNTGISGVIFEYPVVLPYITGDFNISTGVPFSRNTANLYLNGLRQLNKVDYIEGAIYDKLSGNLFNEFGNNSIYDNNGNFWE